VLFSESKRRCSSGIHSTKRLDPQILQLVGKHYVDGNSFLQAFQPKLILDFFQN
jgi:hypothetical protein